MLPYLFTLMVLLLITVFQRRGTCRRPGTTVLPRGVKRARAEKDEVPRLEAYFFASARRCRARSLMVGAGGLAAVRFDMHRGHLDDSPECPCPAPRRAEIIEPINAFHRECRRLGVP